MYSCQQLIKLRILHVVIMIATGIFAYQYLQLDDGLWIPISIIAIVGPFAPGLSISKARQRVLGTLCGLLVSFVLWGLIHYIPDSLVFIALVLIYCVGLTAILTYTYFIFFVSIMLTVSFDYMNLFINNEISYIANRMMCVLIGVTICQFYEYFIFKNYYHNATSLVESERLDKLFLEISQDNISNIVQCNKYITDIIAELNRLDELKQSCENGYSNQDNTLILIDEYVQRLNNQYASIMQRGSTLIK